MVEDRIRNIESRVQASDKIPDDSKHELLGLLAELRSELDGRPHLGESLGALTSLEAEHPRLAALANRIAVTLANMGI